jgi:hypothetical protein
LDHVAGIPCEAYKVDYPQDRQMRLLYERPVRHNHPMQILGEDLHGRSERVVE